MLTGDLVIQPQGGGPVTSSISDIPAGDSIYVREMQTIVEDGKSYVKFQLSDDTYIQTNNHKVIWTLSSKLHLGKEI